MLHTIAQAAASPECGIDPHAEPILSVASKPITSPSSQTPAEPSLHTLLHSFPDQTNHYVFDLPHASGPGASQLSSFLTTVQNQHQRNNSLPRPRQLAAPPPSHSSFHAPAHALPSHIQQPSNHQLHQYHQHYVPSHAPGYIPPSDSSHQPHQTHTWPSLGPDVTHSASLPSYPSPQPQRLQPHHHHHPYTLQPHYPPPEPHYTHQTHSYRHRPPHEPTSHRSTFSYNQPHRHNSYPHAHTLPLYQHETHPTYHAPPSYNYPSHHPTHRYSDSYDYHQAQQPPPAHFTATHPHPHAGPHAYPSKPPSSTPLHPSGSLPYPDPNYQHGPPDLNRSTASYQSTHWSPTTRLPRSPTSGRPSLYRPPILPSRHPPQPSPPATWSTPPQDSRNWPNSCCTTGLAPPDMLDGSRRDLQSPQERPLRRQENAEEDRGIEKAAGEGDREDGLRQDSVGEEGKEVGLQEANGEGTEEDDDDLLADLPPLEDCVWPEDWAKGMEGEEEEWRERERGVVGSDEIGASEGGVKKESEEERREEGPKGETCYHEWFRKDGGEGPVKFFYENALQR